MDTEGKPSKRLCVSTACTACRRRKSKCDGNRPSCACCSSVYLTTCVYDPISDGRRKGVFGKNNIPQTRNATFRTLIQAILSYDEDEAISLVRQIRTCDSLEDVADSITTKDQKPLGIATAGKMSVSDIDPTIQPDRFDSELAGRTSELFLNGSRKFIGSTSNLSFLPPCSELYNEFSTLTDDAQCNSGVHTATVKRWTLVTEDESLITHLMRMYFTWHYPFYTVLAKDLFLRDFLRGYPGTYCSSLLVNSILALGCHFSSWQGAFDNPQDPSTAGNHFFEEARRLALENDEYENASICNVQAFALMSVREAGCGREGKGWVYSGLSFRMALDLGMNVDPANLGSSEITEEEIDAWRITFWGCYMIDKCWSNYLGRQPQLSISDASTLKFHTLPREETELWSPYTDIGYGLKHTQPSRLRTVALQISTLCEISGDIIVHFHHPVDSKQPLPRQSELKKLGDVHSRLEAWKQNLPHNLAEKEGQLPQVLIMHMFYHLLLIHLYRHFLKYTMSNIPLPCRVSPRKECTHAALAICRLLRVYKRSYGLKQICNIAVYIAHTACAVHFLNLPDENAQKDSMCCLEGLEEMAEGWPNARRSLGILYISSQAWQVELPSEASVVFDRVYSKWGRRGSGKLGTSLSVRDSSLVRTDNAPTSASSHQGFSSNVSQSTLASQVKHSASSSDRIATSTMHDNLASATSPGSASIPIIGTTYQPAGMQPSKPDIGKSKSTHCPDITDSFDLLLDPSSAWSAVFSGDSELWGDFGNAGLPPMDPFFPSSTSSTSSCHDPGNTILESEDYCPQNMTALGIGTGNWGHWMDSEFGCQRS